MVAGVNQASMVDNFDFAEVEDLQFGYLLVRDVGLSPLLVELDSFRVTQLVLSKCSSLAAYVCSK